MDRSEARVLRELLELGRGRAWLEEADDFAAALRAAPRRPGGLLLVGAERAEPWHMAAHLSDEARIAGLGQLSPTLIQRTPRPDAPPHLAAGLDRISAAGRSEAVLIVAEDDPDSLVLERVDDARRQGARILTLGQDVPLSAGLAHESLGVPDNPEAPSFDGAQHLVSTAAVELRPGGLLVRLRRWIEAANGPRVERW
ncbi:hypothetical protein KDK95_23910 [Actinospica sp. MGRD01-02]|uniref:SIS domain-containing protein n=1 Tax=Actinospica acidithermotolerans TaxID=2828514 RepID=A0A941EES9_9ACTN|nr:hypothetical protein [Actinospica acidithermotolerans]MBR7829373.1 hypothetical protein [Actinospica acidithermotolerans]